jgi:hypothetical protein
VDPSRRRPRQRSRRRTLPSRAPNHVQVICDVHRERGPHPPAQARVEVVPVHLIDASAELNGVLPARQGRQHQPVPIGGCWRVVAGRRAEDVVLRQVQATHHLPSPAVPEQAPKRDAVHGAPQGRDMRHPEVCRCLGLLKSREIPGIEEVHDREEQALAGGHAAGALHGPAHGTHEHPHRAGLADAGERPGVIEQRVLPPRDAEHPLPPIGAPLAVRQAVRTGVRRQDSGVRVPVPARQCNHR